MGFNSAFEGLKLLKPPGNGRLNNLNDAVLNVLTSLPSDSVDVKPCFSRNSVPYNLRMLKSNDLDAQILALCDILMLCNLFVW